MPVFNGPASDHDVAVADAQLFGNQPRAAYSPPELDEIFIRYDFHTIAPTREMVLYLP